MPNFPFRGQDCTVRIYLVLDILRESAGLPLSVVSLAAIPKTCIFSVIQELCPPNIALIFCYMPIINLLYYELDLNFLYWKHGADDLPFGILAKK